MVAPRCSRLHGFALWLYAILSVLKHPLRNNNRCVCVWRACVCACGACWGASANLCEKPLVLRATTIFILLLLTGAPRQVLVVCRGTTHGYRGYDSRQSWGEPSTAVGSIAVVCFAVPQRVIVLTLREHTRAHTQCRALKLTHLCTPRTRSCRLSQIACRRSRRTPRKKKSEL